MSKARVARLILLVFATTVVLVWKALKWRWLVGQGFIPEPWIPWLAVMGGLSVTLLWLYWYRGDNKRAR